MIGEGNLYIPIGLGSIANRYKDATISVCSMQFIYDFWQKNCYIISIYSMYSIYSIYSLSIV